jgi:hypothetical protein
MVFYVRGLYSEHSPFTRIRLEFQDITGDVYEFTYGECFTAEAPLFNLTNLVAED